MLLVKLLTPTCVSMWQMLGLSALTLGVVALHLLVTLFMTLLRTLLTAMSLVAFLHLLTVMVRRIWLVRTLCSRMVVRPSLGTKHVGCTRLLMSLVCLVL